MKKILIIIIGLFVACNNVTDPVGNNFNPIPAYPVQVEISHVITGFGDPVNIQVNDTNIIESQFPFTNTFSNVHLTQSEASVSYQESGTVAKISLMVYTNGVLVSSNYKQGTNFLMSVTTYHFTN